MVRHGLGKVYKMKKSKCTINLLYKFDNPMGVQRYSSGESIESVHQVVILQALVCNSKTRPKLR